MATPFSDGHDPDDRLQVEHAFQPPQAARSEAAAEFTPALAGPPRIWPVFAAYLAAFMGAIAGQIVVTILIVMWFIAQGEDIQELGANLGEKIATPTFFMLMAAPAQLAIALAALLPAWWERTAIRERLGLVSAGLPLWGYLVIVGGVMLPTAIGLALAEWLARYIPADPTVAMMYENLTLLNAVPFVLFIALAPGLAEELLFRGYMQRRLLDRWAPWKAILTTSLLFALLHIMPHAVLLAFPIGIWLGIIAWRTGSIWPCIACHAFINGSINLMRAIHKLGNLPEPSPLAYGALLTVAAFCFLASVWILARRSVVPKLAEASLSAAEP